MKDVPAVSLTALLRIVIEDDLGEGLNLGHQLILTNNRQFISGLMTEHFRRVVGFLESKAILDAPAVVFSLTRVKESDLPESPFIDELNAFLYRVQRLLLALWLQKDNPADFELGFFEAPHRGNPSRIASNFLAVSTCCADGSVAPAPFKLTELEQAAQTLKQFKPEVVQSAPAPTNVTRVERALYLVQAARAQPDLSLKVAFCCMCFEALFSTSPAELAHKLAERVAYFLGKDASDRAELYERTKEAYTVRSSVLHGDVVSKKLLGKLSDSALFCDRGLRAALNLIFSSAKLATIFTSSTETLEAYMRDLTLGINPAPSDAA